MHNRVVQAVEEDLVGYLNSNITGYQPVANMPHGSYRIGDIEDANVLIQNSLWLNVPIGQLEDHQQVTSLQDRQRWADNQIEQIRLIRTKFDSTANLIEQICV